MFRGVHRFHLLFVEGEEKRELRIRAKGMEVLWDSFRMNPGVSGGFAKAFGEGATDVFAMLNVDGAERERTFI